MGFTLRKSICVNGQPVEATVLMEKLPGLPLCLNLRLPAPSSISGQMRWWDELWTHSNCHDSAPALAARLRRLRVGRGFKLVIIEGKELTKANHKPSGSNEPTGGNIASLSQSRKIFRAVVLYRFLIMHKVHIYRH
mmetsp:Transcript_2904/g.4161  ORF Transcript_2904/g.4161 Transcript_2904/m.4161 type:complete len:136 (-) Transcript_2904:232-639(-)